jgi:hypothetical protein
LPRISFDGVAQAHALHRLAVDAHDQVAGLHAGALRRRVVDGGDDLHEAVLHADLDAEPAELAGGADAQVAVGVRVEVRRVRVEPAEHAADGAGEQLAVVDVLDVVALDAAEDLGEGAQVVERQALVASGTGCSVTAGSSVAGAADGGGSSRGGSTGAGGWCGTTLGWAWLWFGLAAGVSTGAAGTAGSAAMARVPTIHRSGKTSRRAEPARRG